MTDRTVYTAPKTDLEKQREYYTSDEHSYGLGFAKRIFRQIKKIIPTISIGLNVDS